MRLENNQKNFVLCLLMALFLGVSPAKSDTLRQLWFGGEGPSVTTNSVTDNRVARINTDGSGLVTALPSPNANAFLNVQLDTNAGLFFALSADGKLTSGNMSVSALPHVYSGIGLSGLNYLPKGGTAQYTTGSPDVAALYSPDSKASPHGAAPAVFIPGPFGTLSNFSASYTLQSSSGPSNTAPYWVLQVSPPNDSDPNDEFEIIQFSTGPTLGPSTRIHVYDSTGKLGSYFGTNFSDLINTSVGAYKFGDMTVDWAGVEIGDWDLTTVGDTNAVANANISSMTLTFVPQGTLDTIQITDNSANDLAYAMGIDPIRDLIYIGLWGADPNGADMIEVTYNPLTGVMTTPYDPTSGTVTDPSHVLMNFLGTGLNFVMPREMWVAPRGNEIYYVDNDFGDPGDFADQVQLNGVYLVSTTDANPIPQQLSDPNQFPGNNSQGYIVGLAVNIPKALIYFATAGAAPGVGIASNTIWSMPINGGTATAMPMPTGVKLVFPNDTGGCLALDTDTQVLYVSDEGQGKILELGLSAQGTNFTRGSAIFTLDANHLTDGPNKFPSAFVRGLTFATTTGFTPPPESPELTIVQQGTNAIVSWPTGFSSFNLQSAPTAGHTGWTNYPGPFVTNSTSVQTTSPIVGKALFFRLSE
ncbi:MAG TPA: hypothetical protein VGO67_19775 [Verrucomicrobiae bacterium]|jgi:hypothetical protein